MKNYKLISALLSAFLISACTSEPDDDLQDSIVEATPDTVGALVPSALFDPSNSIIPFPNNLLLSGSTDGTLNIPVADDTDFSDPQVALNAIDGFSTVAPMSVEFSTTIDPATVNGTSVRVYQVTLSGPGGAVVNPASPATDPIPLAFGVDYLATLSSVDPSQSTVAILPLIPLPEKTSYMVVITDDLMTTSGEPFGPSVTYRLIKNLPDPLVFGDPALPGALQDLDMDELASFESLRQLINVSEATVAAFDGAIEVSDIIVSLSFTTQSIGDVLTQVRTDIRGGAVPIIGLVDSTTDSPFTGAPMFTGADIFVGSLQVPYYLTAASGINDPTPLDSYWQGPGGENLGGSILPTPVLSPALSSTETIPMMLSIPHAPPPLNGYPVVIYQHGITTNRATLLAVADAFANLSAIGSGYAVIAIDLPMHGLTGNETNGTEAFKTAFERTFDVDLVTQDATTGAITAEIPDSVTDTSGRHYINLRNLLNSRDNIRQAVSDLFTLTYAIEGLDALNLVADNCNPCTFDESNIHFIGHSLGAIVGTTYTAIEQNANANLQDSVFVFGGGGVAKTLDGSATFGPSIAAGLAANGVIKGTPDYESFLGAAQTVVDSGDAINHAADLAANGEGILYFEIVGGGGSPSDLVVPNTVPDGNDTSNTVPAPLAGTEPVLALMNLTQTNTNVLGPNAQISVKFTAGEHGSLLDPTPAPAVTTEIQGEAALFIGLGNLVITDGSNIAAP
jgi:pimeloyl-ACP methyl ester carboxylesterase